MEIFIGIGGAWVLGMVAYGIISVKGGNKSSRCNVKREVIGFNAIRKEMGSSSNRR